MRAITDRPYSIACLLNSLPGVVNSVISVVDKPLEQKQIAKKAIIT
jgi:hypothetical protein